MRCFINRSLSIPIGHTQKHTEIRCFINRSLSIPIGHVTKRRAHVRIRGLLHLHSQSIIPESITIRMSTKRLWKPSVYTHRTMTVTVTRECCRRRRRVVQPAVWRRRHLRVVRTGRRRRRAVVHRLPEGRRERRVVRPGRRRKRHLTNGRRHGRVCVSVRRRRRRLVGRGWLDCLTT